MTETSAPSRRRQINRLNIQMFIYSVVFSMAQCIGMMFAVRSGSISYTWVAFALVGVGFMVYSMWLNRYVKVSWFMNGLMAFIIIGLIPLSLPGMPEWITYCVCTILCFGFTCYDLMCLHLLSHFAMPTEESFMQVFSSGRFANAAGMVVGWLLAFISTYMLQSQGSALMVILVPDILVMVLVGIVLLTAHSANIAEAADAEAEAAAEAAEDEEGANALSRHGNWRAACDNLISVHSLTPREAEVMRLLARGRDTNYISDKLFVSHHTVKSHVYHIYQKTDVHTQQELISMVEEMAAH